MLKNKIFLITSLVFGLLFITVKPAFAEVLAIQQLPSFINKNDFKLSCTSSGGSVQFEVSKHGGSYTAFGPSIDTDSNPCIVQVTSTQVNDQTDYTFRAGAKTTSTNYDSSGPSPVSGYYKERIGDGEYKLHWRNPGDTDFDKVVIYRGDTVDFSADGSHEIARVAGSPNSDMTYDDHFAPDSNKTYFYSIRALDHAGNSSSLTGDGSTTTTIVTSTGSPVAGSGRVTILPKEAGQGSVLGAETSPSASPAVGSAFNPQGSGNLAGFNLFTWIFGHKKISLGIAVILIILGYYIYKSRK